MTKIMKAFCTLLFVAFTGVLYAQTNTFPTPSGYVGINTTAPLQHQLTVNGQLAMYGPGLDGSLYQRFLVYSEAAYGVLMEAPVNGQRYNYEFSWRGEGASTSYQPGLFIQGATRNVGIGTRTPGEKFSVEAAGWQALFKNTETGNTWRMGSSGTSWSAGTNRFIISPTSASLDAAISITNNKNVAIGHHDPRFRLHVYGGNSNSDYMNLGTTGTGVFALTSADGGAYGLFAGVSNTGRSWIQGGRYDSNNAYDIIMQGSGGNIGVGNIVPTQKVDIAGRAKFRNVGSSAGAWYTDAAGTESAFIGLTGASSLSNIGFFHNGAWRMVVDFNGNMGIGTQTLTEKLNVNGKIRAEEVQVVVDVPADYVFNPEYKLMSLSEVEKYIQVNRHLPNIPGAAELMEKGWSVGQMSNKMLEKIEELTLHVIELNKEKQVLQSEIERLKSLEARLAKLEEKLRETE